MNTKLFIFFAFFFIFASAFAVDFNNDQFGNIEEGDVANLTVSRVKRADKGCNTLIPVCVQTMCNQCCNKGCKGQDCWQPMCSLCCS